MRCLVTVGLIAVAMLGCKRTNELYCDENTPCSAGFCNVATNECEQTGDVPDAATIDAAFCSLSVECVSADEPICDDSSGACRGCEDGPECAAKDSTTPECTGDGRCVECLGHGQCTEAGEPICRADACAPCASGTECVERDAAAPVCAPTGECVQCYDHDDCTSTVCDRATHTCVDGTDVIYVDGASGDDSGSCGALATPCQTIVGGVGEVTAGRSTLRIAAGNYAENDLLIDGIDVTLIGPGVHVTPTNTDVPVIRVQSGGTLLADGLTVRSATGNQAADGIYCTGAGSRARIERVTVTTNDASGVQSDSGCALELVEAQVARSGGAGVKVYAGELAVERSTITENRAGGIDLENSPFAIVNNFVRGNGSITSGGSLIGGISIRQDGSYAPQQLEFNTVVENLTGDSAQASGVFCFGDAEPRNNIVYSGVGSPSVGGTCTWSYSDVQGGVAGATNFDDPPQFVDPSMDDYHLKSSSPARNTGDPASTVTVDFDGDARPLGGAFDIGADELVE